MEIQKKWFFHTINNNNNIISAKASYKCLNHPEFNWTPSLAFRANNKQNGTTYLTKFLTLHPSNAQKLWVLPRITWPKPNAVQSLASVPITSQTQNGDAKKMTISSHTNIKTLKTSVSSRNTIIFLGKNVVSNECGFGHSIAVTESRKYLREDNVVVTYLTLRPKDLWELQVVILFAREREGKWLK